MEKAWKVINLFIGLVLIGLCSGFPIGLENSAADYHTQFLTGLVGVLLTVCGVVFLAGCLCCQRKNGFKEFHNNPVVASSTSSLDHGHINPIANGEFTIFTPLSPPVHNNNVFLANEQIVGQTKIDYNHAEFDVRSWFDGTETDFPRTRLKYIKELGKGWFGRVVEGTAQISNDRDEKQNWTPVAVRILEASATSSERAVFLHDAVIYRCGTHPHILQLLGRSLESVPLLLLQEISPRGDLKKYLRDNRATAEKLLSSDLPLLWCCQLSSALKHLHDHRLTHPDLAARNCQVMSDLSLKLGDYGLAASLYPEDYYEGAPAVPVRWCAPESLTYTSTTIQPKQITFESNIWSLGVTMWEIYECGALPYENFTDDDVISQVLGSANVRLSKPQFSMLYTDYIFRLMQLCWSTSESRPSVSQVHLMLTDLMQVYQNTKHITHSEPPISLEDFDKRWDNFKPNSVAKTDNHEFQESISMADIDLSDITILNLNLNKDEELSNTKPMSPSLNNLHGSLDNLATVEMDSWLQKVATKTGDMSYVRGISEAIQDLDNALALENVSSSDSSHQPSPAPETLPTPKNKLEFKLGPTYNSNDSNKTQNSSLTESMQRTSSESETEDENWRRKIERGAYSEKVQQKSKSVTDLMVLTHIDCSESDSETPLPSLDYRVNYKNVRYAPKQNLENVSLMFGSEGNLLSVHDKFQEELRRLQEERKDSLLFVPESISHNDQIPNNEINESLRSTENSSSDEETWTVGKSQDANCTYVNINPSTRDHRNPESLIEELSSPSDIQPANQVYNIFNVTVDANFSPMHLKSNLQEIICFKDTDSNSENHNVEEVINKNITNASPIQSFQVPKLTELIQNNDDLMDYIITKYDESQEDVIVNTDVNINISENKVGKELNNNIQNSLKQELPSSSKSTENVQTVTQNFLQNEQQNYELPKVNFDISQTQEEVSPSSMTHLSVFTSTPFTKRTLKDLNASDDDKAEALQFSSNFLGFEEEEGDEAKSELKYSLETWDNFLGKTVEDGSQDCSFTSQPQSLLFVDENKIDTVECKNEALIESFHMNENDLDVNINEEENKETKVENEESEKANNTFVLEQNVNTTFVCADKQNENKLGANDATIILGSKDQELDGTYTKEHEGESNWEPGEGWFLHPQTNSEVSGQMEAAQGGEESYVGFSMDDEIMAAIRNELLMKLPQAQGQSSEQVKDTDDWDTEGRSEVLIKYNVYTTPLSPIPEESYSENDSYHLIYNREDNSDSENEDWPEPYEEQGLPDTETQSMQNAESPIPEPQNRHTPSQDSCCSNDTLFNLEELTFVVNENDNLKLPDLMDKKMFERKESILDRDIEEPTLKVENKNEIVDVSKLFLENEIQAEEIANVCNKNRNNFKAEIFTCNIEPTPIAEILDNEAVVIEEPQIGEAPLILIEDDSKINDDINGEDKDKKEKIVENEEDMKKEDKIKEIALLEETVIISTLEDKSMNVNDTKDQEKNVSTFSPENSLNTTENIENCVEENDSPRLERNEENEPNIDAIYKHKVSETDINCSNVKTETDTRMQKDVPLEKSVDIISCDVSNGELESCKELEEDRCQNTDKCEQSDRSFTNINEESEIQVIHGNEVAVSRNEVTVNHNEINIKENPDIASERSVIITLDAFNNMELKNAEGIVISARNEMIDLLDSSSIGLNEIIVENNTNISEITSPINFNGEIKYENSSLVQEPETNFQKIQIKEGAKLNTNEAENKYNGSIDIKQAEENIEESLQNTVETSHDGDMVKIDIEGSSKIVTQNEDEKNVLHQNGFLCDTGEVNLENINLDFIRTEADLTKTDLEKNKLNKKTIQNGTPWITNENHSELLDIFDNLNNKNEPTRTEPNEKTPDTTDISLIVENNPNYITEFLNQERLSTIVPCNISILNPKQIITQTSTDNDYVNIDDISVKIIDRAEISGLNSPPEYVNTIQQEDEHLYDPVANEDGDDIYDALTDIRFTGPTDVQLMSTSFSESAEIDEQDWDSGSDTRSSSSGEFIWKEGEHEESVKALRAAPQDVMATEKLTPMEDIEEVSTESSEDEDGDSPEFVPSAWDKYATPTKSALRSPEKTLEKSEVQKKPKGVWFKKQKYHCVYEYPREPESPNVNSFDLWQPVSTSLIDWEVDTNPYGPMFDGANPHPECYQQLESHGKNLYQHPDFASGMTALDDEFFISSTARPFESFGGLSSQFFPGQTTSDQWMDLSKQAIENITPDSGVEDITPSNVEGKEFLQAPPKHQVQPLRLLATVVLKNNQISELKSSSKDSLGGLRYARNKLKLDLPPSPSAFTSTKAFTIEPPEEPVTKREVPTFTTFGKSRFLVQHVDTPTCDEENESKNVSFEALPYKPAQVNIKEDKTKIEVVRGEASLLDSADEDSGIESSTLERKKITNIAD